MVKRILICPLDWGLGHATRCIPVIRELQKRNIEVFIASSGSAHDLLQMEFPELNHFELPAYNPIYSAEGFVMSRMLLQISKFNRAIHHENDAVRTLDGEYGFDLIISDNRYGCWLNGKRSILITHQTSPRLPEGFGWMSFIFNYLLRRSMRKFSQIWIPDQPGSGITDSFNGKSHFDTKYIGWLSRFSRKNALPTQYQVLAVISGPAPQRTIFKDLLIKQLQASGLKSLLIAGDPSNPFQTRIGNLTVINHLPAAALEEVMLSAGIIVCRSGYSTIMDLIALGIKAILVPTPGQPEQVTLAEYFKDSKVAMIADQNKLSLVELLKSTEGFTGFSPYIWNDTLLSKAINEII